MSFFGFALAMGVLSLPSSRAPALANPGGLLDGDLGILLSSGDFLSPSPSSRRVGLFRSSRVGLSSVSSSFSTFSSASSFLGLLASAASSGSPLTFRRLLSLLRSALLLLSLLRLDLSLLLFLLLDLGGGDLSGRDPAAQASSSLSSSLFSGDPPGGWCLALLELFAVGVNPRVRDSPVAGVSPEACQG